MNWVGRAFSSSIGCKVVMALTGIALVGFLVAHLAGNLLVFAGPEAMSRYAEGLRDYGPLLWLLRLALLAAVILHIYSGLRLTRLNSEARPQAYKVKQNVQASFASRFMGLTGLVVLAFILYHLAHLTFRWTHPEFATFGPYDVYPMMIISFQSPLLSFAYVAAIVLLMVHLNHGLSSLFQTLGLHHSKYKYFAQGFGPSLSTILGLGFISIPFAILLGFVR